MTPLVWFTEQALRGAGERIASGAISGVRGKIIKSEAELGDGSAKGAAVFVDRTTIGKVGGFKGLVIAVSTEPVPSTIPWLRDNPTLCHVVSASLLEQPLAASHLANVMSAASLKNPRLLDWIDNELEGRRVRLANASRRSERLDKMTEFFTSKSLGPRTIEVLRDAAEELLTNAFYNAPVAAGV